MGFEPATECNNNNNNMCYHFTVTKVQCLSAEYFDIFLIHRERDEPKISKLKDILYKFVSLPDGRRLTFSLEEIAIPFINDKFEYFEKSLERSRYKFIYIPVDEDFSSESCEADEDAFQCRLNQHYALKEMIRKRDNSIVPVTDSQSTKVPQLLSIFRHLDLWRLLKQRSLDDICDVENLTDDDLDVRRIDFIRHMFDPASLPTPRSCVLTILT